MGKKLTKVKIKNVLRLKCVEMSPEGPLYVIEGQNGNGKSSILKCIQMLFAGDRSVPDQPIHKGASKGEIKGVLDDGTVITRTFTASGTKVSAKLADGRPITKVQTFLKKLFGPISFDPSKFMDMKPKERLEILKEIVGLDFSELDQDRQDFYEERTNINREVQRLKSRLIAMPEPDSDTEKMVDISELLAERDRREKINRQNAKTRAQHQVMEDDIEQAEEELEQMKAAVRAKEEMIQTMRKQYESQASMVESLQDEDVAEITRKIQSADEYNNRAREAMEYRKVEEELSQLEAEVLSLTDSIATIDEKKAKALEAADFPVEGLGFGDDDVMFGDLPFDQASTAEQVRISVAIGLAMHPELDMMLIDDGEKFDDSNLQLISDMAEQAGVAVLMAKVGNGQQCQLFIKDGEAVAV